MREITTLDDYNLPPYRLLCTYCKHLQGEFTCAAYPEGIPPEVYRNDVLHTRPYRQENAIVFEPREDALWEQVKGDIQRLIDEEATDESSPETEA